MTTRSALSGHLDEIWEHPAASHALALGAVPRLTPDDLVLLAAWDTAASYGPARGSVVANSREALLFEIRRQDGRLFLVAGIALDPKENRDEPIIRYRDRPVAVYAHSSSPLTPNVSEEHDLADLLVAAQLVRDHVDTALLLPEPLRTERLSEFASLANCSLEKFKMPSIWFPQIERDFALSLRRFS